MSRHYVITISRQFGTGGREIGKALGAALEVPVYDRELLEEAARTYCIPVSVMERNDETAPSRVLESFALSAPSLSMLTGAVDYSTIVTSDTTFAWQSATIRRLAKEGPCVIIGRCADHVLRGTPLEEAYHKGLVPYYSPDAYADLLCSLLPRVPASVVLHRLTGDGDRRLLLSPLWSADKKTRPQHPETPFSGKKCRAGQFFSKNLLTMIVIKCIIGTTTQKGR